jgi:hypothetical protein
VDTPAIRPRGPARSLAAGIYGAVLATALVAAFSEDHALDAGWVAVAVAVTVVVFWLVHAYATLLAGGVLVAGHLSWSAARAALADELPLVLGALPVIAPLLLAPAGMLSTAHAENLALATGVATLGLAGAAAGRRQRAGLAATLALAAATAAVGGVMVALKAIVH